MMTTQDTPRVWVGCLACYNAGRLVGEWVDGIEAAGTMPSDLLQGQHNPNHEELWVMDHEGYGPALKGECSPAEAQRIAEILDEHADNAAAFAAWIGYCGSDSDAAETFEDAYMGEWESERDFAENLADDIGMLSEVSEAIAMYFDYDAWTRDLFIDGYMSEPAPGFRVYVFLVV